MINFPVEGGDRDPGALVQHVLGEKLSVPGEPQAAVIVFRRGRTKIRPGPSNTKHRA
jgi:hypothetical protein